MDSSTSVGHDDAIVSRVPQLPPMSDPLSEILHSLHLSAAPYCVARLGEPWGIEVPRLEGPMTLQIVTAGQYWVEVDGAREGREACR